jgi:hypothetical protein
MRFIHRWLYKMDFLMTLVSYHWLYNGVHDNRFKGRTHFSLLIILSCLSIVFWNTFSFVLSWSWLKEDVWIIFASSTKACLQRNYDVIETEEAEWGIPWVHVWLLFEEVKTGIVFHILFLRKLMEASVRCISSIDSFKSMTNRFLSWELRALKVNMTSLSSLRIILIPNG